jgi:hypothetical protein
MVALKVLFIFRISLIAQAAQRLACRLACRLGIRHKRLAAAGWTMIARLFGVQLKNRFEMERFF